ncbi:MerR family transcriptional regulator [Streptomyces sp. NPDC020719]|uniref:MerR family transcriptional regulator n=1 Tax=unclassified Streptomyces TaxID=2593676 RepID=UPI0033D43F5B
MRIGELSERTGTPRRLLRYYEEQGLLGADRTPNGYREYDDASPHRVLQIRGLLDAGLPTRIIKQILPCLDDPGTVHLSDMTPETITGLELHRDRMTARINCLTRNRDAVANYLATLRPGDAAAQDATGTPSTAPSSTR